MSDQEANDRRAEDAYQNAQAEVAYQQWREERAAQTVEPCECSCHEEFDVVLACTQCGCEQPTPPQATQTASRPAGTDGAG